MITICVVLMSARKITMYTEKRKKNLSGIIVGSIRSYISTCIGSIVGKIKDKYGKTGFYYEHYHVFISIKIKHTFGFYLNKR